MQYFNILNYLKGESKMRRMLSLVLVLSIILSIVSAVPVMAYDDYENGECGEGVFWEYDASIQALSISGDGDMEDYDGAVDAATGYINMPPWYEYRHEIMDVFIDDDVTDIGDFAFAGLMNVRSITIPASVKSIGDGVFYQMDSLVSVRVASKNTEYSSAGKVLYNKDKTEIIKFCGQDEKMCIIPDDVTKIAPYAFANCYMLESIMFGENLEEIGKNAFASSCLTNINYKGTEEEWREINIDSSNGALTGATNNINFESVLATGIDISENEITIAKNESYLLSASILPENAAFHYIEWTSSDTSIAIVDSYGNVTGCKAGVVTITAKSVDGGFTDTCTANITDGGFAGNSVFWSISSDGKTLTLSGSGSTYDFGSITQGWINYGDTIETVIVEEGVTYLGNYIFSDFYNLKNVTLPSTLTYVGYYAFNGCHSLSEIYIPASVKTIGDSAFYDCYALKKVSLCEGLSYLGASAFNNCNSLETVIIPDSVTTMGDYCFAYCGSLKSADIGDGISQIPNYCFRECSSLVDVKFGTGLKNFGNSSFYYCTSLKSLKIPEGVTELGDFAFQYCTQLENVELPNTLKTLNWRCFSATYSLYYLNIPSSVTKIESDVFNGSGIKLLNIPSSVTSLSSSAFAQCRSLETVIIPSSIKTIPSSAFYYDTALRNVVIKKGLTTVSSSAFNVCYSLADVYYEGTINDWSKVAITSSGNSYLLNATKHYEYTTVSEIIPEETEIEIDAGNSMALEISYEPLDADFVHLIWSSSDSSVATVDQYGNITGVKGGSAIITVKNADGSAEASYSVKVNSVPVTGITLDVSSLSMIKTRTANITANIAPYNATNKNIIWKSSDENVATVDATGYIYAQGQGSATITATTEDGGFSASVSVTVSETIAGGTHEELDWTIYYDGRLVVSGEGAMPDFWVNETDDNGTAANSVALMSENNISSGTLTRTSAAGGAGGNSDWDANLAPWYRYSNEIQSVEISDGITYISDYAFAYLYRVYNVYMPATVTSIGDHAFESMGNLGYIQMSPNIETIGDYAFAYCSAVSDITLCEGLKTIGKNAFEYCRAIKSIEIPESVTSVGELAFTRSDIKEVTIGKNLTSIGNGAFSACQNITEINVNSENTAYTAVDGVLYNKDKTTLVAYPAGKGNTAIADAKAFVIPETVTKIADYAFRECKISGVQIPECVTEIGNYAFERCESLKEMNLPENLTALGEGVFQDCSFIESITIPANITVIPDRVFSNMRNLSEINIEGNVTKIGDSAFSNCGITEISLPDTVTEIDRFAFYYCQYLEEIILPESLVTIGEYAFADCSMISEFNIPDNVTNIGNSAFRGKGIRAINVSEKNKAYSSIDGILFNKDKTTIVRYPASKETYEDFYIVPQTVTKIGEEAFNESYLFNIILPDGLLEIEDSAFSNCGSLNTIVLPESLTTIGRNAFSNTSITSVAIPSNVSVIPENAFGNCYNLNRVTIGSGVERIENWAFSNCNYLNMVNLNSGIDTICDYAFAYCYNINTVRYTGTEEEFDKITIGTENQYLTRDTNAFLTEAVFANGVSFSENVININVGESKTYKVTTEGTDENDVAICQFGFANILVEPDTSKLTAYGPGIIVIRAEDQLTGYADWCVVYAEASGTCGENAKWYLSSDRVLTISGTGAMEDYLSPLDIPDDDKTEDGTVGGATGSGTGGVTKEGVAPWRWMEVKKIVIESGITTIGDYSFIELFDVEKVEIADTVKSIGTYAFDWNEMLEEIHIPEGVEIIKDYAFGNLMKLEKITVDEENDSFATVDNVLFDKNKTKLILYPAMKEDTYYKVPETVTEIAPLVANHNQFLKTLNIPESVTVIGDYAFDNAFSLMKVKLPENITYFGTDAFSNAPLVFVAYSGDIDSFTELVLNKTYSHGVNPFAAAETRFNTKESVIVMGTMVGYNGKDIIATANIRAAFEPYTMVVAYYDENDHLESFKMKEFSVEDITAKVIFEGEEDCLDKRAKIFMWNGPYSAKPVSVEFGSYIMPTNETGAQLSIAPYADRMDKTVSYTYEGECRGLEVMFSPETRVEDYCDYIYIYDENDVQIGSFTGTQLSGMMIPVAGKTVKIRLVSDSSISSPMYYGVSTQFINVVR